MIAESGSLMRPIVVEDQVEARFEIARRLGFCGTDVEELVQFLKLQSAESLTKEAKVLVATRKTVSGFSKPTNSERL